MSVAEHFSRVRAIVKHHKAEDLPRMAEALLGALLHLQAETSI